MPVVGLEWVALIGYGATSGTQERTLVPSQRSAKESQENRLGNSYTASTFVPVAVLSQALTRICVDLPNWGFEFCLVPWPFRNRQKISLPFTNLEHNPYSSVGRSRKLNVGVYCLLGKNSLRYLIIFQLTTATATAATTHGFQRFKDRRSWSDLFPWLPWWRILSMACFFGAVGEPARAK